MGNDNKSNLSCSCTGIPFLGFWVAAFMSYSFYSNVLYAILCGLGSWVYVLYNVFFYWQNVKALFN